MIRAFEFRRCAELRSQASFCDEQVSQVWCGRGDSNPYGIATASPSSWCVCQFRHFRDEDRFYLGGCCGGGVGGLAGVVGAGLGAGGAAVPLTTDPGPRWPMMASAIAPTMKSAAR